MSNSNVRSQAKMKRTSPSRQTNTTILAKLLGAAAVVFGRDQVFFLFAFTSPSPVGRCYTHTKLVIWVHGCTNDQLICLAFFRYFVPLRQFLFGPTSANWDVVEHRWLYRVVLYVLWCWRCWRQRCCLRCFLW